MGEDTATHRFDRRLCWPATPLNTGMVSASTVRGDYTVSVRWLGAAGHARCSRIGQATARKFGSLARDLTEWPGSLRAGLVGSPISAKAVHPALCALPGQTASRHPRRFSPPIEGSDWSRLQGRRRGK